MSHTKATPSSTELKRKIARLEQQLTFWKRRVAEIEGKLAITLPILTEQFNRSAVHLTCIDGQPVLFADDVIPHIAGGTKLHKSPRGGHGERLRLVGLGQREMLTVSAEALSQSWNTSYRHLCAALGKSTKARTFCFVTTLGMETLRDRAPEFCAWVEGEAFPAVLARFGKGGAV